jgi:hypothetical protein
LHSFRLLEGKETMTQDVTTCRDYFVWLIRDPVDVTERNILIFKLIFQSIVYAQ